MNEYEEALSEELPAQRLADHEVYLSFTGDEDGIAFREWWRAGGAAAFLRWRKRKINNE
jgi:hypothetical protein